MVRTGSSQTGCQVHSSRRDDHRPDVPGAAGSFEPGSAGFEPYATLLNQKIVVPSQRTNYVAVDRNHLISFLEPHIRRILVDEAWYLNRYPDVAEAVKAGDVPNAAEHYWRSGYYEHRLPYDIEVDESWYLSQYPDIRDAVSSGVFASGRSHFHQVGFAEGRLPFAHFTFRSAS